MNRSIADFAFIVAVVSEPSKPRAIEIDSQWVVTGYQNVEAQVELLSPDQ